MNNVAGSFRQALDEVSASSAGGAPFLICYGITFIITAVLSFFLPRETSAIIVMFQGGVALPASFQLERMMGQGRMSAENPLKNLSAQLAVSQALAIPFLIVAYTVNPNQIPVIMAGLGGVHFLPYAWLHRTRLYIAIGVIISLGAFALILASSVSNSYPYILLLVGLTYLAASPLVYRHAKKVSITPAPSPKTLP